MIPPGGWWRYRQAYGYAGAMPMRRYFNQLLLQRVGYVKEAMLLINILFAK
jgi:hypothetical protein